MLLPLAGNSSRGPTPGTPNQADVLMVYAAAEGKVITKPSYTELNLLARDLKWR